MCKGTVCRRLAASATAIDTAAMADGWTRREKKKIVCNCVVGKYAYNVCLKTVFLFVKS